jgi:hypothetical protein
VTIPLKTGAIEAVAVGLSAPFRCARQKPQQPHGGRSPALLQVVADYERVSAVLGAGRAGHRQASGPQYPGVSIGYITR